MLRPIKRVWVPPTPASALEATAAVSPAKAPAAAKQVFSESPETEVQERDSDSIWAEFESVYARASANKTNSA
jgi:hypothetical protein